MSKYEPLKHYLSAQTRERVPMTFDEIEQILGCELPPSKMHRAWWSNNASNNVMTKEWLSAGYETESVNVASGKLIFRRHVSAHARTAGDSEHGNGKFNGDGKALLAALRANLAGLTTINPNYEPDTSLEESWPEPWLGGKPS